MHPTKKQNSLLPPKAYIIIIILLNLSGIAVSTYLAVSHYRNFTDIGYQSFCAISRSLNCDTVSQSPYAVFLGAPLAVWGGVGYLFFLVIIRFYRKEMNNALGWAAFSALAAIYCLISIWLAVVSSLWVRSYCLMCMLTYAINFMLLLLTWFASRRFGMGTLSRQLKRDLSFLKHKSGRTLSMCAFFTALLISIAFIYPNYWNFPPIAVEQDVSTGITEDGYPWIGAENPALTIVEFSDYMCFQCGKMHKYLRRLINQYPDRIRLVHRHFPLDHQVNPMVKETIHPNAGLIALFAIFAQGSDRFWHVNDQLFRDAREQKKIHLSEIAKENGLDIINFKAALKNMSITTKLEDDIQAGLELGITATPSFVVEGELYSGTIPEEILNKVMQAK